MVERTIAEIWQDWLGEVRKTKPAEKDAAEAAVVTLYGLLHRVAPTMTWAKSPNAIKADEVVGHAPLPGIVDMLFLEAWHRLELPETQVRGLGYSEDGLGFRLTDNYQLAWRLSRLTGLPRNHPRPTWMRLLTNLVTQFDAGELAVWEYGVQADNRLTKIGYAVKEVLRHCHGIIMFTDACVLIERPKVIHLDESMLLSSTTSAALEWRDRKTKLYAVNGVALSPDSVQLLETIRQKGDAAWQDHYWFRLQNMRNAAERVALIELMGWARFLEFARNATRLHHHNMVHRISQDQYGELWQVTCGNQLLMLLKVVDKSPSEKGIYETHVIPVDPRLRPLPNPRDPNGVMGRPQRLTPLNAVASTFGMTGPEYATVLGDES
jgi:hypothetical protein